MRRLFVMLLVGAGSISYPFPQGAPKSAHYVTTQAEPGLTNEAVVPTCTGTDKLTFNGVALSCAVDAGGAGSGYNAIFDSFAGPYTARTNLKLLSSATSTVSCADNAVSASTDCTVASVSSGVSEVHITSDYTNATTTLSTVSTLTWLSTNGSVSTSGFDCTITTKSSAATLGTEIAVNSSVAPTNISYRLDWLSAAGTAPSTGGTQAVVNAVANATVLGPTVGLTTYTTWRLSGVILHTSTQSTVSVQAKASSAGTVTIARGSRCLISIG